MKDAKQFYKEHGLSEDTIIYINDLHWLVDNYYDEAPYIEDMVDLLGQAIRDSKIETVGDTIQCMDIRKKLLKIHKQTIT